MEESKHNPYLEFDYGDKPLETPALDMAKQSSGGASSPSFYYKLFDEDERNRARTLDKFMADEEDSSENEDEGFAEKINKHTSDDVSSTGMHSFASHSTRLVEEEDDDASSIGTSGRAPSSIISRERSDEGDDSLAGLDDGRGHNYNTVERTLTLAGDKKDVDNDGGDVVIDKSTSHAYYHSVATTNDELSNVIVDNTRG